MPSTYTTNNGIELIATGEQSGTWGDTTNTNLELLDASLDGQVTITLTSAGTSSSPNTLPITDGTASDGRNRLVEFDDGADLGATAYVQLTPNDAEKIVYIRNSLSGSRDIIVFQGTYSSSNDYVVPNGTTAVVYFNGGGTGAVAANVFNNAAFDGLQLGTSDVSVNKILDQDDMSGNDASALATQQSIKAYVDSQVTAQDLDFGGDSGTGAVDLDSQTFTIAGTSNEIETSASGQTLTIGLPDDVTIAGDLTVDTDTLYVDSTNNRVGIGEASPDVPLHIKSADNILAKLESTDATVTLDLIDDTSTGRIHQQASELRISSDPSNTVASSSVSFYVDGSEAARFDNGQRLLVGHTSSIQIGAQEAIVQVIGSGAGASSYSAVRYTNTANSSKLTLGKSRSTTLGSNTIVQDDDAVGIIDFAADDGTDINHQAASIQAAVDGTPGTNDMPGRLVFSTTADGGSSPTERMRINNAGYVNIGSGSDPDALLRLNANTPVLKIRDTRSKTWVAGETLSSINFDSADASNTPDTIAKINIETDTGSVGTYAAMAFSTATPSALSEAMRIDSSQRVLIGHSSSPTDIWGGQENRLQVIGNNWGNSGIGLHNYQAGGTAANLSFSKSRSGTVGTSGTVVSNGDRLGYLNFAGDDGTDINSTGAAIEVSVDGTPGSNDMPGRIIFKTTADGSVAATERMRISRNGFVGIGGATDPDEDLHIRASQPVIRLQDSDLTDVYAQIVGSDGSLRFDTDNLQNASGTHIAFKTDNSEVMRMDDGQRVLIGLTSAQNVGSVTAADLQVETGGIGVSIVSTAGAAGPAGVLVLGHKRGAGGVVSDDDALGDIRFAGHDGSDLITEAARIRASVDGTPGSNDMPGRIEFATSSDGSSSPTERMRLNSNGHLAVGNKATIGGGMSTTSPDAVFTVQDSGAAGGKVTAVFGADTNTNTLTDNTFKEARVGIPHYDTAQEPAALFYATSSDTSNDILIGGGTSRMNAATRIFFRTASNSTTTTGTNRMSIDSGGRVTIGTNLASTFAGSAYTFSVSGTSLSSSTVGARRDATSSFGPYLTFGKTRASTIGGTTIVQNGDYLGSIRAAGADGGDVNTIGGIIDFRVDGTPGSNDLPTRIIFSTTADGNNSPTERMRIRENGRVGIGTTGPKTRLDIAESAPKITLTSTDQTSAANQLLGALNFYTSDASGVGPNNAAVIEARSAGSLGNNADLVFKTKTPSSEGDDALETIRILNEGGITFNGDTATANALDDYEEGTWTPTLRFNQNPNGITYSTQSGAYTKIGRMVYINANLILTSKGSNTGDATIAGLPFTVGDNLTGTSHENAIIWNYWSNYTDTADPQPRMYATGSNIILWRHMGGTDATNADFTNTTSMRFSGWYMT